jgi:hypothetical protein
MLSIKRKSKWRYKTAASAAINAGFVGVSMGVITLISDKGQETKFHYKAMGGGGGVGFKLPITGSFAAEAFPSVGQLYMLTSYHGQELRRNDITGGCAIAEISASSVFGASASVLLLGMEQINVERDIVNDLAQLALIAGYGVVGQGMVEALDKAGWLANSATALLIMAGVGGSTNVSASGMASVGWLT